MAECSVLTHSAKPGRERFGEDQLAEELLGILGDLRYRCVLVAAVEEAQEVAAVLAVDLAQRGCLGQRTQHVANALGRVQAAGGEPRVALHHVAGDERVLQVERGHVAVAGEYRLAQAGRAVVAVPARCDLGARVVHDRREVDGADVRGPVHAARVEVERRLIGGIQRVPHRDQLVDLVDRLALGVQAVQLHVLVRPVDLVLLLLQVRCPGGLATAQRQRLQHSLGLLGDALRALQLFLHATTRGELPLRHFDRLALRVVQRVLGEPGAHVVDQQLVLQRVDASAGHLGDRRSALGTRCRDCDDGRDDDVDRDDVDGAFGNAGELLQQPTGVAEDDWLGHAETTDPAGERLGQRRFDDAGSHDADRHVALGLGERLLAERLGVGVGVGPTDAGGASAAGFHQLRLHPCLAQALRLGGECRAAGCAQLLVGFATEVGELLDAAAGGVYIATEATAGRHFLLPVEADVPVAFADQRLRRVAAAVAGDIAGAHAHHVGRDVQRLQRLGDAHGAHQVDLDGAVQRAVERHGGGGVDDNVAAGEHGAVNVVQPQPVGADIAADGHDAAGDHGLEVLCRVLQVVLEAVEGVVLEDLAPHTLGGVVALAGPHEQYQGAAGGAAQQALDERGAHESGAAGDGYSLVRELFGDHAAPFRMVCLARLSTIW